MSTLTVNPSQPYVPYWQKLKDPRWQKKRLEILNRDNFTCRDCQAADKELHVHHTYYERGVDPWDHLDYSLLTLCPECHESRQCAQNSLLINTSWFHHSEIDDISNDLLNLSDLLRNAPLTAKIAHSTLLKVIAAIELSRKHMAELPDERTPFCWWGFETLLTWEDEDWSI